MTDRTRYAAEIMGYYAGPSRTCQQSAIVDLHQARLLYGQEGGYVTMCVASGSYRSQTVVYPVVGETIETAA